MANWCFFYFGDFNMSWRYVIPSHLVALLFRPEDQRFSLSDEPLEECTEREVDEDEEVDEEPGFLVARSEQVRSRLDGVGLTLTYLLECTAELLGLSPKIIDWYLGLLTKSPAQVVRELRKKDRLEWVMELYSHLPVSGGLCSAIRLANEDGEPLRRKRYDIFYLDAADQARVEQEYAGPPRELYDILLVRFLCAKLKPETEVVLSYYEILGMGIGDEDVFAEAARTVLFQRRLYEAIYRVSDRNQVVARLREFIGKEELFTKRVVMPMFASLGFSSIRYRHGSQEGGLDIVMRGSDKLGGDEIYGIQVKARDLHADASRRGHIADVLRQLTIALSGTIFDIESNREVELDRVYLISCGTISQAAREAIRSSLVRQRALRILGAEELAELLIDKNITI